MPRKQNKKIYSCVECNITNLDVKLRRIVNIYLCDICVKLDKYIQITKTFAKTTYYLSDDDLVNLDYIQEKSREYHKLSTYYNLSDIKEVFCNKYGIRQNQINKQLEDLSEQKDELKQERLNRKQEKIIIRQDKLIKALNKVGLELREDSNLCKEYINGSNENKLKDVVDRMCQMKYLFEYCHMDECKKKVSKYDNFNKAENLALKKYSNGNYPEKYPWLE